MRLPFLPQHPTLVLGTYGPPFLPRALRLGPKEVTTHKHVIGVTGVGKSKLLTSILCQLLNQGIPCALLDPHTDLAHDILGVLVTTGFFDNPKAYQRLLYIDWGRHDRFLPFNVLAQPYDPYTTSRMFLEAVKRAWPSLGDGQAPMLENIVLAATLVLVQNSLPLTAMPRLLSDKPYRDGLLVSVSDPEIVSFFTERFDRWGRETPLMVESTLRRIFLLTFSPVLRYTLGQHQNALDFRSLIDKGISVIFDLGGVQDADSRRLLGCLITVGFEQAALSRADIPPQERGQYHLLLDEFSEYVAQSEEQLARILSLTRKYGLYLTCAHQTWSQASERLAGALQNVGVEVAFRLGRADAELDAKVLGRVDPYAVKHEIQHPNLADRTHPVFAPLSDQWELWVQALQDLKVRQAFVKTAKGTFRIKTLNVPDPDVPRETLDQVLQTYAETYQRPREGIDREIGQNQGPPPQSTTRRVFVGNKPGGTTLETL